MGGNLKDWKKTGRYKLVDGTVATISVNSNLDGSCMSSNEVVIIPAIIYPRGILCHIYAIIPTYILRIQVMFPSLKRID